MRVLSILAFLSLFCGCGAGEQELVGEQEVVYEGELRISHSVLTHLTSIDAETVKQLATFKGKLYTNFTVK